MRTGLLSLLAGGLALVVSAGLFLHQDAFGSLAYPDSQHSAIPVLTEARGDNREAVHSLSNAHSPANTHRLANEENSKLYCGCNTSLLPTITMLTPVEERRGTADRGRSNGRSVVTLPDPPPPRSVPEPAL